MSQNVYAIHIPTDQQELAWLPMGGTNPQGITIAANQYYLTLGGQPWLPVMGEFHFSRYPEENWETELLKMKAGGISVVATYLFWIHIEEVEGQFDWSGRRNLRRFVELCAKHGLYAYPRIGPWAHGECRNGGFPDWLVAKCGKAARSDDPMYLAYVRRFYGEISRQMAGLLWKDGGPVIGTQLENELLNNAPHIHTLKQIAREVGLDVPIYTMTGWGPADVPEGCEVIPVFGGYPDAFWDRQVEGWSRASRKHYFFSALRDDNTIGADLNKKVGVGSLDYLAQFPFGTCETGGGMQLAYHRRPIIDAGDVAALAWVKVGNGSNLQGYYMYHGGANPSGMQSTMQESQVTGYANDLPVINYDFQAPLGQYGQVRESFHALRELHLFLQHFSAQLAPLPMTLPDQMPSSLDDRETLRWAVRSDGRRGFLFINNYQRIEALPDHPQVQFQVTLDHVVLTFPQQPVRIPAGVWSVWPINLDMQGVLLEYATAQPVCIIEHAGEPWYVFTAVDDVAAEFAFDANTIDTLRGPGQIQHSEHSIIQSALGPGAGCVTAMTGKDGRKVNILLLNQTQARQLYKTRLWGQDSLILSEESLYFTGNAIHIQTTRKGYARFSIFPDPHLHSIQSQQADGIFQSYAIDLPDQPAEVTVEPIQPAGPARSIPVGAAQVAQAPDDVDFETAAVWRIHIPLHLLENVDELYLDIDYVGDVARLYLGDRLIDDDFYHGSSWEIGLKRFTSLLADNTLTLRVLPLRKDAPIYLPEDARPQFSGMDAVVGLAKVALRPMHEIVVAA